MAGLPFMQAGAVLWRKIQVDIGIKEGSFSKFTTTVSVPFALNKFISPNDEIKLQGKKFDVISVKKSHGMLVLTVVEDKLERALELMMEEDADGDENDDDQLLKKDWTSEGISPGNDIFALLFNTEFPEKNSSLSTGHFYCIPDPPDALII